MRKLLLAAGVLALLIWPGVASAAAPPSWNLTGTYTVDFTCTANCSGSFLHTMVITTSDDVTGAVVGSGSVNGMPGYDWTIAGQVSGNAVTLSLTWTGPGGMEIYNPLVMTGTIDANGVISGTSVDAQERAFTWATTEGHAKAVATATATATATAVATATPTPFQTQLGATATARSSTTLAPTSTESSAPGQSAPIFALLICLAFGGLGLVAVTAQRHEIRD